MPQRFKLLPRFQIVLQCVSEKLFLSSNERKLCQEKHTLIHLYVWYESSPRK